MRRLPVGDFGSPLHRDAVESNGIIDQRANLHCDWQLRIDSKGELRRREPSEILRIGEEWENCREAMRNPHLAGNGIFLHCVHALSRYRTPSDRQCQGNVQVYTLTLPRQKPKFPTWLLSLMPDTLLEWSPNEPDSLRTYCGYGSVGMGLSSRSVPLAD